MKKLAIVCGSPTSEMLAPFDDEEYEIWVLGTHVEKYKRFTRIFEIHENLTFNESVEAYINKLNSYNVPIVVNKNYDPRFNNTIKFPLNFAEVAFGSPYLTSSCAYMVALAIKEDYNYIEIYGVDLDVDDNEYFYQKPCVEAWIGFARGRGIKVVLPPQSSCLKSSMLYGNEKLDYVEYDGLFSERQFRAMADVHAKAINDIDNKITYYKDLREAHGGSLQAYNKMAQVARASAAGVIITDLRSSVIPIK